MKKDVIFNFCKRIGVCKGAHLEHVPKLILDARIGHKQILQHFLTKDVCFIYFEQ